MRIIYGYRLSFNIFGLSRSQADAVGEGSHSRLHLYTKLK